MKTGKMTSVCRDCREFLEDALGNPKGTVMCRLDPDNSRQSGWRHNVYWPEDFDGTYVPSDCMMLEKYEIANRIKEL